MDSQEEIAGLLRELRDIKRLQLEQMKTSEAQFTKDMTLSDERIKKAHRSKLTAMIVIYFGLGAICGAAAAALAKLF